MDSGYKPARIDKNSIKTTTMLSFIVFAIALMLVVWMLASFFVDTYYASVKSQEAIQAAKNIETQFIANPAGFDEIASQTASSSAVYIRIDSGKTAKVYDGTSGVRNESEYDNDISIINAKLKQSPGESVTAILKDKASDKHTRLVYGAEFAGYFGTSHLYVISPLYPDQATLNIIRTLLIYVSIIVVLFAGIISILLSGRLTKPIESLTQSAKEMSHGNYTVRFSGGGFTETKELANALNKASYEMEKTDFYQREIIANVSHDLKTPLTMIRSYAEKIIDISGDNPEKRNSDCHIIISETERLNTLVQDMMTVSNLQSNKVELNKETFNLVDAAGEVFDSFVVLNESEGYDISFSAPKPAYVLGDRSKIMQVMSNFISNAVKYSGDNKYVEIQVKKIGKKVAFHCIDHGIGIPADEQQHVWDRYYRTSANHERDIEGTGLGLSIVKGILTLHNAAFGVKSEEGKGSDFWFEMDTVKKPNEKNSHEDKDIVIIGDNNGEEK